MADPVTRKKLSDGVLDRMLREFHSGKYPPGTSLPSERELMNEFRVGRPAVREALQDLQRMGLIAIVHGERARATAPTPRSVIDQVARTAQHLLITSPNTLEQLKEARVFFELGIVRIAAARAQPDQIRRLRDTIAEQAATGTDFGAFLDADVTFHRRIAEITNNSIFSTVSQAMLEWLTEHHQGLIRKVGREQQTLEEHRAIVDRIEAHDVEGAAAAMLSHLTRAQDLYQAGSDS